MTINAASVTINAASAATGRLSGECTEGAAVGALVSFRQSRMRLLAAVASHAAAVAAVAAVAALAAAFTAAAFTAAAFAAARLLMNLEHGDLHSRVVRSNVPAQTLPKTCQSSAVFSESARSGAV